LNPEAAWLHAAPRIEGLPHRCQQRRGGIVVKRVGIEKQEPQADRAIAGRYAKNQGQTGNPVCPEAEL
jgi:hypothetical protein